VAYSAGMRAMKWTWKWMIVVAILAVGCGGGKVVPELVGKWSHGTTAADGVHGTNATYELRGDGTFRMTGYPPIEVNGRWEAEKKEGKVRLKLKDQRMKAPGMGESKWNDEEGEVEMAQDGTSFTFNGKVMTRSQ